MGNITNMYNNISVNPPCAQSRSINSWNPHKSKGSVGGHPDHKSSIYTMYDEPNMDANSMPKDNGDNGDRMVAPSLHRLQYEILGSLLPLSPTAINNSNIGGKYYR